MYLETSRSEYEQELNNVLKGALRGDLEFETYEENMSNFLIFFFFT